MIDLARFEELVPLDHGLSVVVTRRSDHTPHTSVVNAGVVDHPVTGERSVAFVAAGGTRKLAHLRTDPTIAVVVRAGWQWTVVEGRAQPARRNPTRHWRAARAGRLGETQNKMGPRLSAS